jgi:hypothetical protein
VDVFGTWNGRVRLRAEISCLRTKQRLAAVAQDFISISVNLFVLVRQAATKARDALETAYSRKMVQAGEACRREGMVFVPMPWETLGGWHEETVEQVKKLASVQARQTGEDRSEAIRHLYQKLSVLLTRGNAALFLNRQPSFPSPDIDGVL